MDRIYRHLSQLPESPRALLVLLMFSALLMGALFIVRIHADLNYDGEIYIAAAMKFAGGMHREGLAIYPMPVYPILIALTYKILPDWVLAGRLISFLSMTVMVIPVYLLTRDLFSSRAAFWSGIVFILLPETLLHSNSVLRDPPFFLFFIAAAYFAQKALQSKQIKHLLCSAVFALVSTLFRVEGLIIFPVCLCVFVGLTLFKSNRYKQYLKITVGWGIICSLLVAGFLIWVNVFGSEGFNRYNDWGFYYSGFKDLSLFESYHRIADQLKQIHDSSTQRTIGKHFSESAKTLMPFIFFFGMLQVFSATILTFNLIPLTWGFIKTKYHERHFLILALAAGLLVLSYGFFIRMEIMLKRYLMMPGILLSPWIGFGIDRILRDVQILSFKRWAAGCIVLMVFVIPATGFDHFFKNKDDLASRAGAWLATNEKLRNSKIVFNDQIVKFYADMEFTNPGGPVTLLHLDPSDKDFTKLLRYAKDNKADGIVIQDRRDGNGTFNVFPEYKEIKEFTQKKKFIKIFLSEK